jgi:hypothetical protein
MLSNEEFQLIADWLLVQGSSKHSRHAHDIKTFIGFEPGSDQHYSATAEEIKEKIKIVIRNYYNLNRLALTTRYGDPYDRKDEVMFTPKNNPMANERKAIQALQSLSYQCAEYIVCETSWHKELKIFIGKLCENIFRRED